MYKKEILYCEAGELLEEDAQRGCGYPLSGSFQGQVGWCSEQLDWVEPCLWQGVETR